MELSNEILESLDEEMRAKVVACETPEDLMELAMASGVDLTEEQRTNLVNGAEVYITFEGKAMHFFDPENEQNLIYGEE